MLALSIQLARAPIGCRNSRSGGFSVLYIGPDRGTSRQRCNALRRLGYQVHLLDPFSLIWRTRWLTAWNHHTGSLGVADFVRRELLKRVEGEQYDLVWVDGGTLVSPQLVLDLRDLFGLVLNYNIDDPFGTRDGPRFRQYLKSVPHYDLLVLTRDCNVEEALRAGARNTLRVFHSADEVSHAPRELSPVDLKRWYSDVTFIGTWMPERGPFLSRLIELDVPLTIRGNFWNRAPEWNILRPHWKGPGLTDEDDYAHAIQYAKVSLGLLSKGNRDCSTTRSFEIPFLGGVLCAERTGEHSTLYQEDVEATFWSSPEECASKCKRLLSDDQWRNSLKRKGRARCIQNNTVNGYVVEQIMIHAKALLHKRSRTEMTCVD